MREALKQLDKPALRAIRALHGEFASARPPGKGEQQSPAYALRMLTLDILENWNRLTCHLKDHEPMRDRLGRKIPRTYQGFATNNACENAIGRGGARSASSACAASNARTPSCPCCFCSLPWVACSPESPSRA